MFFNNFDIIIITRHLFHITVTYQVLITNIESNARLNDFNLKINHTKLTN